MASITDENEKQIRDNINLTIVIVGQDTEPFLCQWDPDTMRMTWTATDLPHEFLTVQCNDKTEYVVTAGKRWHPNPSGYVFLPEHSSQIKFVGDGAAPHDADNPHAISGFSVDLDARSITTCTLALRSSLELVNPSWETSEINLSFILPDVTPEALQFIATNIDGADITYHAGYNSTDMIDSTRRFVCTNEGIDYSNGEITLTGVDQSEKLSKTQAPRYFTYDQVEGFNRLYALFRSFITGAGIDNVTVEDAPAAAPGGSHDTATLFLTERVYNSYIHFFMRHMCLEPVRGYSAFWPRYVDAGRPTVTWRYPEPKWIIKDEECGNIVWRYEPVIKSFSMNNEAATSETPEVSREDIETKEVKSGRKYWFDVQDPHRAYQCTNATIEFSNAYRVKIKATVTGSATLSGIPIEFYDAGYAPDKFEFGDYGQELEEDGDWYFENATACDGEGNRMVFAAHADVYDHYQAGNITQTVTFTWKGDPRMQPLDIFIFDHGDTSEAWTIGSITLDHTGGGLTAEITARRGEL